jgi:hypothetical protein
MDFGVAQNAVNFLIRQRIASVSRSSALYQVGMIIFRLNFSVGISLVSWSRYTRDIGVSFMSDGLFGGATCEQQLSFLLHNLKYRT